jgi:hypothetical protein
MLRARFVNPENESEKQPKRAVAADISGPRILSFTGQVSMHALARYHLPVQSPEAIRPPR